jgi:hypothetical protein
VLLAWGRRFSQCARDRGLRSFPDPQYLREANDLIYPDVPKEDIARAQEACLDVLREMPPRLPARPPSARQMREMRAFAKCLRDHGLTGFPDPKADGTFPIRDTPLKILGPGHPTLPPAVQRAWDACFNIQTDWRMLGS